MAHGIVPKTTNSANCVDTDYNGLHAYLKLDLWKYDPDVEVAQTYMGDALGESYLNHMRQERFPVTALAKDLSESSGSLRMRRFKFPRAVLLSGPPTPLVIS